jgi:D-inositol-3-phosphate glycosyltransferase
VDGRSGYLIPHGVVDEWADRIALLCGDPQLREQLGIGAIEHAARFTWEQTADETEALIRTTI